MPAAVGIWRDMWTKGEGRLEVQRNRFARFQSEPARIRRNAISLPRIEIELIQRWFR